MTWNPYISLDVKLHIWFQKKSPKKHLFYPRCKDILNETMQRTRKRPQNQEWCQEKLIRACHICFKSLNTGKWITGEKFNHDRMDRIRWNYGSGTDTGSSADVRQLGIPGKIIGSCLIQLSKMIKIILKNVFVSIL